MQSSSRDRRSRMPSAKDVHLYWTLERQQDAYDWFDQYDPGEPSCYACGWYPMSKEPGYRGFERSHLIDHAVGGSSDASNLVLLCTGCNGIMPLFRPGQIDEAISWIRYQPSWVHAGLAKAQSIVQYVDDHGELPSWLTRDALDPEAVALLKASAAEYLGERASEAGELFPGR